MRYTLALCVMGFLGACGGEDPAPYPSAPEPAALEACQKWVELQYCPKVELCVGGTHADCVRKVSLAVDCGTQMATNFPRCERELADLTCLSFGSGGQASLPHSCDVFLGETGLR